MMQNSTIEGKSINVLQKNYNLLDYFLSDFPSSLSFYFLGYFLTFLSIITIGPC
jgi:hypothetical protein